MSRPGEFELIERYLAPLSGDGSFGLKDDAAWLQPPVGERLVVTHDTIIEGIHFLSGDPSQTIAQKALRVNLSDLFAKGAKPLAYTLSLGLPDGWEEETLAHLAQGLSQDQSEYNLTLLGGDTYRSPERLCLGVSMFGMTLRGSYVSRLNAQDSEVVAVTGSIGNAALGLNVVQGRLTVGSDQDDWLIDRYRVPRPHGVYGELVSEFASSAMDISDGLLGDLVKLCSASDVSANVERNHIPLSDATLRAIEGDDSLWSRILSGGDDYEILMTLPRHKFDACAKAAKRHGIRFTEIGHIFDGPAGQVTLQVDGKAVDCDAASYSHF